MNSEWTPRCAGDSSPVTRHSSRILGTLGDFGSEGESRCFLKAVGRTPQGGIEKNLSAVASLVLLSLASIVAQAQTVPYPTKSIRMVITPSVKKKKDGEGEESAAEPATN